MKPLLKSFFLSLLFCSFFAKGQEQLAGGEITYKCKGNNQYDVKVVLYGRCPNPGLPATLTSIATAPDNQGAPVATLFGGAELIIPFCPGKKTKCEGGTEEGIVRKTYNGTITLPGASTAWGLDVTVNGIRTPLTTISDFKGNNLVLTALINNNGVCNSSVVFDSIPPTFSPIEQAVNYSPVASNPGNEGLQVSLIGPRKTSISSLNYIAPYSATQPIKTTGPFALEASTGKMSFTPSTTGEASSVTVEVKEIKDGKLVGSAMKEIFFQTMPKQTAPPRFTSPDNFSLCQRSNGSVTIEGESDSPTASLDIVINNPERWGTPSVFKQGGKSTLTISANTNTAGDIPLSLTMVDQNCNKVQKTFTVSIKSAPTLSFSFADTTVACLNNPITIKVPAITGGTAPFKYTWTPTAPNSNVITVNEAGIKSVTIEDANGCTAYFQKEVKAPIKFDIGKARCIDGEMAFYDISRTLFLANPPKAEPLATTKEWKWDFGDGKEGSTASPTHKYDNPGTYTVKMEISDGNTTNPCKNSYVRTVKVYPKPQISMTKVDSCQKNERTLPRYSDLKIQDQIVSDTTVQPFNIEYTVTGPTGTHTVTAATSRNPTDMRTAAPGQYTVVMKVTDDAQCVVEETKIFNVRHQPKFLTSPIVNNYVYGCDSPGFPDTTFNYTATAVGEALTKSTQLKVTIQKLAKQDSAITYTSTNPLAVPYKIVQNQNQTIRVVLEDVFGCINDTTITIRRPIEASMKLDKYYCFVNDNLKISNTSTYHWGVREVEWDSKDGKDTTKKFLDHVYGPAAKSMDEANISLKITDKRNCTTEVTPLTVYLSEPDTSLVSVQEALSCFSNPVNFFGIKNKYINTWYYKFNDTINIITQPSIPPIINPTFGTAVPATVDQVIRNSPSGRYIAKTTVFYNERNPSLNLTNKVCSVSVKRRWRVLEQPTVNLLEDYDHCFDQPKVFKVSRTDKNVNLLVDELVWTLQNPARSTINTETKDLTLDTTYSPATSLFSTPATTRQDRGKYPPYHLSIKYKYSESNVVCYGTAQKEISNEKVKFSIQKIRDQTCMNFTNKYEISDFEFLDANDRANTVWDYGNNVVNKGFVGLQRYSAPGRYEIKAKAVNTFGCTADASTFVVSQPSPEAIFKVDPVCQGLESVLDASASHTPNDTSSIRKYYWYLGDKVIKNPNPAIPGDTSEPDKNAASITGEKKDSIIKRTFNQTQLIGLIVENSYGCYDETTIIPAYVNPGINADFSAKAKITGDEDYLGNEPIMFRSLTPGAYYWKWDMGDGNVYESTPGIPSFDREHTYPFYRPPFPKEKNMYDVTLIVRTQEGCADSVTKKIDVNAYFELPNAFSPNEDGLHDVLLGVGKGIKEIKEFKIFNRWGEVIFSVSGKPEKDALRRGYLLWDGVYNGQKQPVGAYVYYAVVSTGYGDDIIKKGNLTLLR